MVTDIVSNTIQYTHLPPPEKRSHAASGDYRHTFFLPPPPPQHTQFANQTRQAALVESVVKAVALSRKHDALADRYLQAAETLRGWIANTTAKWEVGAKGSVCRSVGRSVCLCVCVYVCVCVCVCVDISIK